MSNESLSAQKWFPADCELSYNDIVRWIYDSLYEINLECDIISAYSEDIEKYDMIVVPALYCVNKGIIERLNKFVRKGGVLVSSFRSFVADTDVKVFCGRQPYGMTECFGMSYNQFTRPENAKVSGKECRFFMEPSAAGNSRSPVRIRGQELGKVRGSQPESVRKRISILYCHIS